MVIIPSVTVELSNTIRYMSFYIWCCNLDSIFLHSLSKVLRGHVSMNPYFKQEICVTLNLSF